MSKRGKRGNRRRGRAHARRRGAIGGLEREYRRACELATEGKHEHSAHLYKILQERIAESRLKALVVNDLAAIRAVAGDCEAARKGFEKALAIDRTCEAARENLRVLVDATSETLQPESTSSVHRPPRVTGDLDEVRVPSGLVVPAPPVEKHLSPPTPLPSKGGERGEMVPHVLLPTDETELVERTHIADGKRIVNAYRSFMPREMQVVPNGVKVAIVSFLFNWPSTGGGIIHTVELATFLIQAGFEVRHFYAKYPEWGVGKVDDPLPFPSEALEFNDESWNALACQQRFRDAVRGFAPDHLSPTRGTSSRFLPRQSLTTRTSCDCRRWSASVRSITYDYCPSRAVNFGNAAAINWRIAIAVYSACAIEAICRAACTRPSGS